MACRAGQRRAGQRRAGRRAGALCALVAALLATAAAAAEDGRLLLPAERPAIVELATAALVMSGQEGGALPVAVAALPAAGDGAVTVLVEVDGGALLELHDALPVDTEPPPLRVFLYVLGPELEVVAQRSLELDLDPAARRDTLAATGVKAFVPLALPAGTWEARALARFGDEAFGVRGLVLAVGDPDAEPPPVHAETRAPWLVTWPAGAEVVLPPPYGLRGGPLPAAGAERVAAAEPAAPRSVAPPPPEPGRRLERADRRRVEALAGEYREALRRLAAGDDRAAAELLGASEVRVAERHEPTAVLTLLGEAQERVFAGLRGEAWRPVLPVILLHAELLRAHSDAGRTLLARHANRRVEALAAGYARALATPEARLEAARILGRLGGHFLRRGDLLRAEELYTAALELAGNEERSLFHLALLYEKRGRYDRVVPLLRGLLAARPEHAEGRLRLAINLARTGETGAARALLRALADEPVETWTALLAYQALARLEIDHGRPDAAREVLERGLERWPGHPALALLMIRLHETRGEPRATRALIERLRPDAPGRAAAERSRYNAWPDPVEDPALDRTAAERLPELERWLARRDGAAG